MKEQKTRRTYRRKKLGRTTVDWGVQWMGMMAKAGMNGDAEYVARTQSALWDNLVKCWKEGDATFFRELATCIEHGGHDLKNVELWLYKRLFCDETDPERQTEFLSVTEILDELPQHGFHGVTEERQLYRHMKKIGADYKNSPKNRRRTLARS